jgi:hypothetical protein
MYKIVPWSEGLDLTDFYRHCEAKGFVNNASQKAMIDCFCNEREWGVWILYYNDVAVGSVAAHSIDEGYRICARTCVLSELIPLNTLRTRNQIATHNHVTAQFFMPTCIRWVAGRGDMYITSHASKVGTQRLVHTVWGPTLEKTGVLIRAFEKEYRGHVQTFWKLNPDTFLTQLEEVKWQLLG